MIHITAQVPADNRQYTLLAAWENFRLGFDYFTAGQDITECRSIQQRRGWIAAYEAKHNGDNR